MSQPFVVIKNPHVVIRNVVNLDVEPDADLAGLELVVDFVRIPNEPAHLYSGSSIFPGGSHIGEATISSSSIHARWIMWKSAF